MQRFRIASRFAGSSCSSSMLEMHDNASDESKSKNADLDQ